MNNLCDSLAGTGANTWLFMAIACGLVLIAMATFIFISRKRGSRYKFLKYGGTTMVLLFSLGFGMSLLASTQPVHAAATSCGSDSTSASSSNTSSPSTQSGELTLVDDSYDVNNVTFNEWDEWVLNIMSNDHAPSGDPINPETIRLSGSTTQFRDVGPDYDQPTGVNFDILNPSDPDGQAWGYVYTCTEDDGTGTNTWVATGDVCVYFYDEAPPDTTFTMQYTAKTMSGKDASNTATITFATPPLPPTPEAVDDTYTLGSSGGAVLSVTDNDTAIDPSNIELANPNTEAGGFGDEYTVYLDDLGSDAWIDWQIINGKVLVTFGPDVPFDTPYSIGYHDIISGQEATITVTRASTPASPITVADIDFPDSCGTHSGDTIDIMANVSTTVGTLDPLSIDLDPTTPGRQTSYVDGTATITVDSSGVVTITKPGPSTEMGEHTFYYTIANSNGDVSGLGTLYSSPSHCT